MELDKQRGYSLLDFVAFVSPVVVHHKVAEQRYLSPDKLGYKYRHIKAFMQHGQDNKIDDKTGAANYTEPYKINLQQVLYPGPRVCNHVLDMVA